MPVPGFNDFVPIGDISSLGTTFMTKLAKTFEQFPGDPIAQFFPSETTMNSSIIIERSREGVGIAPLVRPGLPDVLTDNAQFERMQVFPAYIRESDFVPQNVVNDLRKLGTLNEKEGKEFVARRIQRLTNRSNHFFNVLKAQLLQGAISYTDPRTGESLNVSANIPAANQIGVGTGITTAWATTTAGPIDDLVRFRRKIYNQSKVEPTHIIMTGDLLTILEQHPEILKRAEQAFHPNGVVQFKDGKLVRIAGMEILTIDHVFQDPASPGTPRKVWAINKVVILAKNHPEMTSEVLGRMQYCIGEDPMGRPGMWMRSGPDTTPPAAPGRSMQMGNSGLPYLIYPDWVGIATVDTVNNLTALVDPAVTNPF